MRTLGLLLGDEIPADGWYSLDRFVSLSPLGDLQEPPPELVDGEQAYELYNLTERADDLAMEWARDVVGTLEADVRWRRNLTYDQMDLRPLLANRLFRGYFLQRARTYLGVRHILDAEQPGQVLLFAGPGTSPFFVEAACNQLGLSPEVVHVPGPVQGRSRIPPAVRTFVQEIVTPALRHAIPARSRTHTDEPRVVFIERGVLHTEMVARAFDALRAMCPVEIAIIRYDTEKPTLVYPHARYTTMDSYQDLSSLVRLLASQMGIMTSGGLSAPWPGTLPQASLPGILRFVRQIALPSIVHMLELVRRIVEVEAPSLLVTIDETGLLGKAVATRGRSLGVPTLNIQHGIRTASAWIDDQLFDRFAAFGPDSVEAYVARGNDPAIFVTTGFSRYDRIFRRDRIKSREEVAAELGLDAGRPIVMFASQRVWDRITPVVKRETYLALLRAWRGTGAQLVIKLRYGVPDYPPPEAAQEPGWEQVVVTAEYDLYDLMNASDVVVTAYSTVGMEAVAMGVPLLIVNLTGQPDPIPYVQEGVALGVYDPDGVGQALQYLLDTGRPNEAWEQHRLAFIRRHLTSEDGRSAERVAELMREMIGC